MLIILTSSLLGFGTFSELNFEISKKVAIISGIIILAIGIYLIPVGIQYAAGGAGDFNMSKPTWGGLGNWSLAIIVILVSFGLNFTCMT